MRMFPCNPVVYIYIYAIYVKNSQLLRSGPPNIEMEAPQKIETSAYIIVKVIVESPEAPELSADF